MPLYTYDLDLTLHVYFVKLYILTLTNRFSSVSLWKVTPLYLTVNAHCNHVHASRIGSQKLNYA